MNDRNGFDAVNRLSLTNPILRAMVPARVRAMIDALWALDARLGELARVRPGSEPMLAQIRLQYWREALAKRNSAAPDPVLAGVGAMSPAPNPDDLTALVDAWVGLVSAVTFDPAAALGFAEGRGRTLFGLSAVVIGDQSPFIGDLGVVWALCDLGLHSSDPEVARYCFAEAAQRWRDLSGKRAPRPLLALAAVSAMVAGNGGYRRPLRERALLLRIGLTGR